MYIGRFTPAVTFTDKISGTGEHDDRHRKFNYDICQGINMIKLGIVLEQMVDAGVLKKELAAIYHDQASGLLALIRSENNRVHGF